MDERDVTPLHSPQEVINVLEDPGCDATVVTRMGSGFSHIESQLSPDARYRRVHRLRDLAGDESVIVLLNTWISDNEISILESLVGNKVSPDQIKWRVSLGNPTDSGVGYLIRTAPST